MFVDAAAAVDCNATLSVSSLEDDTRSQTQNDIDDDVVSIHSKAWSASQLLFFKALIAALTSGIGGFPLYLCGELPSHVMGFAFTFSAGLMSACSVILFLEAWHMEPSLLLVIAYAVIGTLCIHAISRLVGDVEDFEFAGLKGHSASKSLLIVLSMALHSLGEGISVGVSATAERESIGLFVIVSLAVHNVPEGIAVSLLLINQGMSVWTASIFAVLCNLPQPLIAIPSFVFLETFKSFVPIGYGFACGAMMYVVCTELLPEARHKISRSVLLSTFFLSLGMLVSIAVCAQ